MIATKWYSGFSLEIFFVFPLNVSVLIVKTSWPLKTWLRNLKQTCKLPSSFLAYRFGQNIASTSKHLRVLFCLTFWCSYELCFKSTAALTSTDFQSAMKSTGQRLSSRFFTPKTCTFRNALVRSISVHSQTYCVVMKGKLMFSASFCNSCSITAWFSLIWCLKNDKIAGKADSPNFMENVWKNSIFTYVDSLTVSSQSSYIPPVFSVCTSLLYLFVCTAFERVKSTWD